jgi:gamma-glutamyl:cysteine ligase YbdK (ATP-grasp superfamily)
MVRVAAMKQLTVYDAIRTHARDVVRFQVREALEETLRRLAAPANRGMGYPSQIGAVKLPMRMRNEQRKSLKRRKQRDEALAALRANVRAAVIALRDAGIAADRRSRFVGLRIVK